MSEITNSRLDLYGAEYSKCNHLTTLGFKGLSTRVCICDFMCDYCVLYFLFILCNKDYLLTYLLTYKVNGHVQGLTLSVGLIGNRGVIG